MLTDNGAVQLFDNVDIKGRGNTTWWWQDKKPYQIRFHDKVNLFNMGDSRKYILLANMFDDTSMRNDIAFYLESLLEQQYALTGTFIEIYIDDDYRGLYYLTPKIEIGKTRIDLREPDGIIVELENMRPDETFCYYTATHTCLSISDSVNKDQQESAMQDFVKSYNALEAAISKKDFRTIESLIDVDSFAKYYLLSEFTVNPDAYATSFFFYKDGANDKIHVGPGWDFDLALSNKNWATDYDTFYSPYADQAMNKYIFQPTKDASFTYSKLIVELTKLPEFSARIKGVYQSTMSGHKLDLISYISNKMQYISSVATHDNERWDKADFTTSAAELLDWISKRYDYFEHQYGNQSFMPDLDSIEL